MSNSVKRIISSFVIVPIVLGVFIIGNKYVVDAFISIIAIRCVYEILNAFKKKEYHPIDVLGYLAAISITFLHVIPEANITLFIEIIFAISILFSFILVITKKIKCNVSDIAITLFTICYIVGFSLFVSLLCNNIENGKLLVWYIFIAAWFTDVFAYETGKLIGKHHFTDVSPKKTIEGCIGGVIGAIIGFLGYTIVLNSYFGLNINYMVIIIASIVLSIIGQIGDLAASTIKRYVGIKDYSNLIPGHGGMLDRIDSLIFIAPFTYFIFMII